MLWKSDAKRGAVEGCDLPIAEARHLKQQQVAAQGRFNNEALDRRQAEAIFREHLGSLQKRIVDGYIALLEEVGCSLQLEPRLCPHF